GLDHPRARRPRSRRPRRNRPRQHRRKNVGHRHRRRPVTRPTLGDRVLLERLAANLLDNAVHYNLTGGSVRVVTGSDDDVSYITVTNSGPLVPESAVTSLFEPFTRLEGRVSNSRGAGLGLSIVTSVVNAHHGHLDAEALPNGGMKISARLQKTTVGTSTDDAGQPVKDRMAGA